MPIKWIGRNKRSFSYLEVVLAGLVVGSTLMTLYFGWRLSHRPAGDTLGSYSTMSDEAATPTPKPFPAGSNYVHLKKWGGRFQYDDKLSGVDTVALSGSATDTLGLTSTAMLAKDGACDAAGSALGTLTRYATGSIVYGRPIEQQPDAIMVGHYYYLYSGPTVSCSWDADAQAAESAQSSLMSATIRSSLEFETEPLQY